MNVSCIAMTLALSFALPAAAERMNVNTHSIVINKLEGALSGLPAKTTEHRSIAVRLADLYADRARLLLLAKQEPKKDRQRAIVLYAQVVDQLDTAAQGPVLLQLAHLQNQNGEISKAIKNLDRATTKKYAQDISARANAQLGEIRFRKAEFSVAEGHFKKALQNETIQNRGFITYRLAWAQLNQGKSQVATATLIHLLKTPDLLTVENQEGVVFDDSFHEDITRDLVVFLARGNVSDNELETLLELTPEKMRKENLYAFANELERLGKKYSATLAWRAYYGEGGTTPYEALETQVRVAQLQWDMGRKSEALEEYGQASELWRKKGCTDDVKCPELAKRFKNFVTTWNRVEKDKPSSNCLAAYKYYLNVFDQDPEMYYKAATVAYLNKNHKEAAALFAKSAIVAAELVRQGQSVNKELLEASLMQQIESAELTKDKTARLSAYNTYLELNPKGTKSVEVHYQKAHVIYEMGQHDQAFAQFKEIAFENPNDQRALRVKAADLALDCLAAMKKDQDIFEWAPKFSKAYPERLAEYAKLQRQAVILMATRILDKKDASQSELRQELDKLKVMDTKIASKDEQVLIFKNRVAIGVRLQELDEINTASHAMLTIKGLSNNDKDLSLRNLAWVAELKLDFKSAIKFTRQMKDDKLAKDDGHLRLAMLTELAGQDATKEYHKALKATNSKDKAMSIRATLVRRASRPWPVLEEHAPQLSRNSQLISTLLLEVYGKQGNDSKAKSFIKRYGLKKSSLAKLFSRQDFFAAWKIEDRKLGQHKLYVRSDALLQKTLTERIAKLNRLDYLGREALQMADWAAQLAVLTTVSRENRRLYDDLLKLPAPHSLKKDQRQQYLSLLKAKAEPFKIRAQEASQKLKEFHDNDTAVEEMVFALKNSQGKVRDLLAKDVKVISRLASNSQRRQLENATEAERSSPSTLDIARAKSRLANDPFDTSVAQDLKNMADRRGDTTMVAFLDARIQQLKKGVQ